MKNLWIYLTLAAVLFAGSAAAGEAPAANFGRSPVHDNEIFATFRADRLEHRQQDGESVFLWDVDAWIGSDFHKLFLESEGERLSGGDVEEASAEAFYNRAITGFWDLQLGIRHDFEPRPTRTFAAIGVQGLAPYGFEVDATAYVSEDGDVSAVVEAEYDLLLSQRLILQPRFEAEAALQEVPEYGIGAGINAVELGARLRYEIRRKVAPYVGVSWHRRFGKTADFAESEGKEVDTLSWVAGVKLWF
jgi:copper resistance protein B